MATVPAAHEQRDMSKRVSKFFANVLIMTAACYAERIACQTVTRRNFVSWSAGFIHASLAVGTGRLVTQYREYNSVVHVKPTESY